MQIQKHRRACCVALIGAVCLFFALCLADRGFAVEIVAHRGASHTAPENTLASVTLAWQRDADAAEIDVRLTRDGRIVALHDETTERTAGRYWDVAQRAL